MASSSQKGQRSRSPMVCALGRAANASRARSKSDSSTMARTVAAVQGRHDGGIAQRDVAAGHVLDVLFIALGG